jgi:hypothetical protein
LQPYLDVHKKNPKKQLETCESLEVAWISSGKVLVLFQKLIEIYSGNPQWFCFGQAISTALARLAPVALSYSLGEA